MKSTDRVPLWILVQRLEESSAELEFTIDQFRIVCCRLLPEWYGDRPQAARPTNTDPGTEQRIQEMRRRASRGKSVFHSQDKVIDGGGWIGQDRGPVRVQLEGDE